MPSEVVERIQGEIIRLRAGLELEMLKHDIRLPRPGDVPSMDEMVFRDRTTNDRVATLITGAAGNIWFAYVVVSLALGWVAINAYIHGRGGQPLDEPWAFPVMLLCTNFVQLILPIFILVSQRRAEMREKVKENRDHVLSLIGSRDVLVLFTYLTDFAIQQRTFVTQQRNNQEKLLAIERQQNLLSGELIPGLMSLIVNTAEFMRNRPCMLEDLDDRMLADIINRKRDEADGPHGDDTGEGPGHPGVDGMGEPDGGRGGQPREGPRPVHPPGDDRE